MHRWPIAPTFFGQKPAAWARRQKATHSQPSPVVTVNGSGPIISAATRLTSRQPQPT
jgi:hypothetical protein